MYQKCVYLLLCLLLSSKLNIALAEDEEEEKAASDPETVYVAMQKPFIVTLSDPGKMRYLKTDIEFVVKGEDTAEKVKFHTPLIRNELILLLSSKTKSAIKSVDLRESMKEEALKRINSRLSELDKSVTVKDLLYTTFIVQ